MNSKDKHITNPAKPRLRLEDIPQVREKEVPEGYFSALETTLLGIPERHHISKTVRLRPWILGSAAVAATIAVIMVFSGLFSSRHEVIGSEEAYAYLEGGNLSHDLGLDLALTEAYLEETTSEETEGADEAWSDAEGFLEGTSEEGIIAYLDDNVALSDVMDSF